jgi:hypothetical protein
LVLGQTTVELLHQIIRRLVERVNPLPDLYISAHAAVRQYDLLTREPRRYRSPFPSLTLIAPEPPKDETACSSSTHAGARVWRRLSRSASRSSKSAEPQVSSWPLAVHNKTPAFRPEPLARRA